MTTINMFTPSLLTPHILLINHRFPSSVVKQFIGFQNNLRINIVNFPILASMKWTHFLFVPAEPSVG